MTERQMLLKRTYTLRFTIAGICFGLFFPIVATLIELSKNRLPLTFTSAWHLHRMDPLLWIIDTAPLLLGLFAYLVGIRQDTLLRSNEELRRRDLELKSIQTNIEQRLQVQTNDLFQNSEKLERRATQLEAVSSVARSIATVQDIEQLLPSICQIVSERFGFYHTGIFLLDARREYAVLRASNSPGGQLMLSRGHRLKIGEVGIVGYVTDKGEPRIALDVGSDAVFFDNPDLPQTRSEMALPLIVGGKILGALDVQSTLEAAFSEEDTATLQVLADQIAIAIENASLFADTQEALESVRRVYGEGTRAAWQRILRQSESGIGYVSVAGSVSRISGDARPESLQAIKSGKPVLANDDTSLHLPIKVREEVIGAMCLDKLKSGGQWTDDAILAAGSIVEQLGITLESARLFEETTSRAERERTVTEITTKIRGTTDPQTMLETALEELKQILGTDNIHIKPYAVHTKPEDTQPSSRNTGKLRLRKSNKD